MSVAAWWSGVRGFVGELQFRGERAVGPLRAAVPHPLELAAQLAPAYLTGALAGKDALNAAYRMSCIATAAARLTADPSAILRRHGAPLDRRPLSSVERAAYLVEHEFAGLAFSPYMIAAFKVLWPESPDIPWSELRVLRDRWNRLLQADMDDVGRYYPRALIAPTYGSLRDVDLPNLYRATARIYDNARAQRTREPERKRADAPYAQVNYHFMPWDCMTAAAWDQLTEAIFHGAYGAIQRRMIAPIVEHAHVLRRAGATESVAIVEFGCGTGRAAEQLLDALHWNGLSARYAAVEMSAEMAAVAQKKLARFGDMVRITEGPAEHAPLAPASVDVVILDNLLHEVPGEVRAQLLQNTFAALKPGGLIVVIDAAQYGDGLDVSTIIFPRVVNEPCYAQYARAQLSEQLTTAGFSVTEPGTALYTAKRVCGVRPQQYPTKRHRPEHMSGPVQRGDL